MFSVMFVCLFTGGSPMWPLPIIYLDLTVQPPPCPCPSFWIWDLTGQGPPAPDSSPLASAPPQPWSPPRQDIGPHWTETTASDIWWPSLETCWHLFPSGPHTGADIWWLLKHIFSEQVGSRYPTWMLSYSKNFFVILNHFCTFCNDWVY